jgi:hypothetical protein
MFVIPKLVAKHSLPRCRSCTGICPSPRANGNGNGWKQGLSDCNDGLGQPGEYFRAKKQKAPVSFSHRGFRFLVLADLSVTDQRSGYFTEISKLGGIVLFRCLAASRPACTKHAERYFSLRRLAVDEGIVAWS